MHGKRKLTNLGAMEILTKEQKELLADFLDSLRNYERESHNLIGFDERETSEFVELYEGILCDRKNSDSAPPKALGLFNVSPCYLLSMQDNFYKPLFLFKTYNEAREYAILMNYEFYTIDEVHYNKG